MLVPAFRANAVTGSDLPLLTDEDFSTSLGCSKLQIKKIRKELAQLEARKTGEGIFSSVSPAEEMPITASATEGAITGGVYGGAGGDVEKKESNKMSSTQQQNSSSGFASGDHGQEAGGTTAFNIPPPLGEAGVAGASMPPPASYGPYAAPPPPGYPSTMTPQPGYIPQGVPNAPGQPGYPVGVPPPGAYQPTYPYASQQGGYGGQAPLPMPAQYGAGAGMPPPEWVPMSAVTQSNNPYTTGSGQQQGCIVQ